MGLTDISTESGAPAWSWKDAVKDETKIRGTVAAVDEGVPCLVFGTKDPAMWPDGNPKLQDVITLTDTGLEQGDDDDGTRRLFLPIPSAARIAVIDAIKTSEAPGLKLGGTLAMLYIGDKPSGKGNPQKLFRAEYAPPVATPAAAHTSLI